jgi:anti-sigma factor RsiW
MTYRHDGFHLGDAEFVQLLDGQVPAAERHQHEAHVAACDACAGGLRALRTQADFVSGWLSRTAPPAAPPLLHVTPRARRRETRATVSGWMRAAAMIALLAAPLAAIPPVRAWVAEQVAVLRGDARVESLAEVVGENAAAAPYTIRFVPLQGVFEVVFESMPSEGTLHIARTAAAEASLEVHGRDAEDAPVVAASGIRIRAPESGALMYRLHLPATVTLLRVHAGGRDYSFDSAAIDAGAELQLGTR